MATVSGTYGFDLSVDEIVEEAYDYVGGEHISGEDSKKARRTLNLILREFENEGFPLTCLEEDTQILTNGISEYTLDSKYKDIYEMVCRRDSTDLAMSRMSLKEFKRIAYKSQEGRPFQYTIDREKDAVVIKVYPTPENSTDTLRFWAVRKVDDITKANQLINLPQSYQPALIYGLAYRLSLKRSGTPVEVRMELKALYKEAKLAAQMEDGERTSFFALPKVR